MTRESVPNSTPALQLSTTSPPPLGRRAFGRQRPMSPDIVARNIAESITAHRDLGHDRPISFYTHDPHTQALVQAKLDAMESETDAARPTMITPPHLVGHS